MSTELTMVKLADCTIAWVPNTQQYAPDVRGRAQIFPATATAEELAPFVFRAGRCDAMAHDPRPAFRQSYVLRLAYEMRERDGLDAATVHTLLLGIDEYAVAVVEMRNKWPAADVKKELPIVVN